MTRHPPGAAERYAYVMKRIVRLFAPVLLALLSLGPSPAPAASEHVVLAGGCFWGMQAVFASLRGVERVRAGYAGGMRTTAQYEMVSTGTTGHAESIDVSFDPRHISFEHLLDVYFFIAHDPTQVNRQGPDEGPQYRSEIFYTNARQAQTAQGYIARLEREHRFTAPIVTTLARLQGFYPAEGYHQDFLVNNPENPYIEANDLPKLRALRATYPQLVDAHSAPMRVLGRR